MIGTSNNIQGFPMNCSPFVLMRRVFSSGDISFDLVRALVDARGDVILAGG